MDKELKTYIKERIKELERRKDQFQERSANETGVAGRYNTDKAHQCYILIDELKMILEFNGT
jgi:hypothetical protein